MLDRALNSLHEESPAGLRRMVVFLYLLVVPPFTLGLGLLGQPTPWIAIAAVLGLCGAGLAWMLVRRVPSTWDWVYPAGIAPIVCCGLAADTLGDKGIAFAAVSTAPLAWAAVLFDLPTVVVAWLTSSLTLFTLVSLHYGPGVAAGNTAVFAVIEFLVAWVVYGKVSRFRIARLESLDRGVSDIELVLTPEGAIVEANARAHEAYGYSPRELLHKTVLDLRDAGARADAAAQLSSVPQQGSLHFETTHLRKDGTTFSADVSSRRFYLRGVSYIHSLVRDVSQRHRDSVLLDNAFQELASKEALLQMMSAASPFGYLVVDNRTDVISYFNRRFCEIWGITHLEARMRAGELKNNDIIPDCLPVLKDVPAFAESCKPLQDVDNRVTVEDTIPYRDGRTIRRFSTQIRSSEDDYLGRFYLFEDVTRQVELEAHLREANLSLESSNQELTRLSRTDGLTQLCNRREFDAALTLAFAHSRRTEQALCLLMLDIDNFKVYNDTQGHQAGDECLRRVAATLAGSLRRTTDTVARYGGEEFAVILRFTGPEGGRQVAEQLRQAVEALAIPHQQPGGPSIVTVSVGVGTAFPSSDTKPEALVRAADNALYAAKRAGRNRVEG